MNPTRNRRLACRATALAFLLLFPAAAKAQLPSIGPGSPWVPAPYYFPRGALIAFLEYVNPANDPSRASPYRP